MKVVTEIFSEYVSMREKGLNADKVLGLLRSYIGPLTKANRKELAQLVRNWEKQKDAPEAESESLPKPVSPEAKGEKADWISCPHCSKKNRMDATFCYACGLILAATTYGKTRHFTDHLSLNSEYFGPESVLLLKIHNTQHEYEVRPQTSAKGVSLGRSASASVMLPDVDLKQAGAQNQGVSRLHMSVNYDSKTKALQIHDLGSANGSFINGQRLHPKETRVLRNGDEIKLGRLVMRADFYHPGDEL